MNLLQIEIFVKVVDIGNFTKAGEILAMTQSGISHNIASLESELGIKLLNRGRNGISLTDSGERIINNMRNILSEAESIKQEAASILGIQNGKINIGAFQVSLQKCCQRSYHGLKESLRELKSIFMRGAMTKLHVG